MLASPVPAVPAVPAAVPAVPRPAAAAARRAPADDIVRAALWLLGPGDLLVCCLVSKRWNELAENDVMWGRLCDELWTGKLHVDRRPGLARKLAYYASIAESKREYLTRADLLAFTFSFRFRETAGEDWIERDSWWQGGEARRVKFEPSGVLQIIRRPETAARTVPDVLDELPAHVSLRWRAGFWKYAAKVRRRGQSFASWQDRQRLALQHATQEHQRLRHFWARMPAFQSLRAKDMNIAAAAAVAAAAGAGATTAEHGAMLQSAPRRSRRLEIASQQEISGSNSGSRRGGLHQHHLQQQQQLRHADPLPEALAPLGDCIRVAVNGVTAPTYRVRRLESNWGYVIESCWALYTSFPMPLKYSPGSEEIADAALRLTPEEQDDEIELYNAAVLFNWGGEEGEGEEEEGGA